MKVIELVPEFLGTFALVFSFLSTGNYLVIGLTLAFVTFLIGDLSGANVNPAVSLALLLNNQMTIGKFLGYVMAQLLGGFGAILTYKTIVKHMRV